MVSPMVASYQPWHYLTNQHHLVAQSLVHLLQTGHIMVKIFDLIILFKCEK